jgi:HK97 family phage prohead protease
MDKILHTKAEVVKEIEGDSVEGVVGSTEVLDRLGEVIDQDGWDLTNFKKNPVVLWGHNVREERPPIGKATKVWLDGVRKKKLMFNIKFDLGDTFAADIFRKVKEGFVNTVSVGFMPTESEPIEKEQAGPFSPQRYLKQELLELSFVPVPANPEALAAIKSMGIEPIELKDLYPVETRGVIPFKDLGIAPIGESWDGPGEKAKADVSTLKKISAWFDSENADNKGAYKLPHHKSDGQKAVFRGVAAAMGALLGARGGVDIPDSDKRGVYNHLAKHYKQFDKEAPDFKMIEDQVLKLVEEEITALSVEREEKHQVRLIKKVIKQRKIATPIEKYIIEALKKIDKSLTLRGGDK